VISNFKFYPFQINSPTSVFFRIQSPDGRAQDTVPAFLLIFNSQPPAFWLTSQISLSAYIQSGLKTDLIARIQADK